MRFPSWFGVIRGRKVEDRGRGSFPSFLTRPPVTTPDPFGVAEDWNSPEDDIYNVQHGLTVCPECGEKVALLLSGICTDCGPEAC
jgi:hypothetical protein